VQWLDVNCFSTPVSRTRRHSSTIRYNRVVLIQAEKLTTILYTIRSVFRTLLLPTESENSFSDKTGHFWRNSLVSLTLLRLQPCRVVHQQALIFDAAFRAINQHQQHQQQRHRGRLSFVCRALCMHRRRST